jgi:pimeloyl-ACP methyl ester carboxylesterase
MMRLPRLPTPGIPATEPPRREGIVRVGGRRALGFAEFGHPDGRLVLWHHGTPGARRQVPIAARRAAERLGVRLVCVERPGAGDSTDHRYRSLREWAQDAAAVVDHLGHDEFAVVGLSGGGPYALACAHELADRVTAVGLLGSVCPMTGPDEAPGPTLVGATARLAHLLDPLRTPLGVGLWLAVQPITPLAHPLYALYTGRVPAGDRKVFADPEMKAMLIDDLVAGSRRRFGAVVHDVALFGRPWGFDLGEIEAPVFWWHGDADNLVPLSHAEHVSSLLRSCELSVRPEESHMSGFAVADVVLETLHEAWRTRPRTA